MNSRRSYWLACISMGVMLWSLSCAPPGGGLTKLYVSSTDAQTNSLKSFAEMLAEISTGVGQISEIKGGVDERRICVFEEKHTSVAGQLEIAVMLLRLHDRHLLGHLSIEGLPQGREFPATQWFREMGGPDSEELRNQIAVGLLRDGEISAVELMALVFPDVVVHAADDPAAYNVELTKKAGMASTLYLYRIGIKSARPEHYPNLQQLNQQKNFAELVEYVISLDPWAKERHEQMARVESVNSIEETLQELQEIEERAKMVGAEIGPDEQSAMAEAKAFFRAAEQRSLMMVQTTLALDRTLPLIAINNGAAHTQSIKRLLGEAKATYAVISPLALIQHLTAGDLSYEAFDRKAKNLSVKWADKGLASLLDGRKKPPPVIGTEWLAGAAQFRFATAFLARGAKERGFPDSDLKRKLDALDHLKIKWETLRVTEGEVLFEASVRGQNGWTAIWARGGLTKNRLAEPEGSTLEKLLLDSLDEVRKEPGERKEPAKGRLLEMLTSNIMAVYDKEPQTIVNAHIAG